MNDPQSSKQAERVVRRIDDHWIKLVIPLAQYVLVFACGGLLLLLSLYAMQQNMWLAMTSLIVGTLITIGVQHRMFVFLLSEAAETVYLTNHRVILFEQRLFQLDELREISFEKAKSVTAKKEGLLQNLLNYGTLHFEIGGTIEYVPHPTRLAHEIQEIIRSNR